MGKKSSITTFESPDLDRDATPENTDLSDLDKIFFLREPKQISRFLATNPYLIPLLGETAGVLERYFPDVKFELSYYIDPEIASFKWLTIEIPTKYSPGEALDRLNKFEDKWWIENDYKANGNLTVDVEFV